jgi:glycosyltransferase involved in cell wall biosynthesis
MNSVFVSVLMPVYNAQAYLREAMDSILAQTYRNFEFVIINDGSIDATKDIILSYSDPRIAYYENEENLKLVETLNKGFGLCKGEYIIRMDADDISFLNRIEKQVKFMEAHPEIGISGTAVHSFGFTEGNFYYESADQMIRYKLLHECHLSHPAVILRTSILKAHQLKMTILHGEDYDFFLRIAEHCQMANLPEVLIHYRQLESSMSKANSAITERHSNEIKLQQFHKLDTTFTLEDVKLYTDLAHQNYFSFNDRLGQIESIIIRMLLGNLKNRVYHQQLFMTYITDLWFAFLNQSPVNLAKFKKMLGSDINRYRQKGIAYRAKLAIKLLLYHQ